MNSAALQERFPEVYREFFARCEIVVSAPASFHWAGEYATPYGEIAIRQSLPLRTYVGFEPVGSEGVTFGSRVHYIPSQGLFRAPTRTSARAVEVAHLLRSSAGEPGGGYRIHSIAETPSGASLNSSSAYAAALATAYHLLQRQLTPLQVDAWSRVPLDRLASEPALGFDATQRLGWKLDSIFHGGSSTGSGVFTSLVASEYPVVYATERRTGDADRHPNSRYPLYLSYPFAEVDRIPYWGFRLQELFGFRRYRLWPFDFGLIYCGENSSAELTLRGVEEVKRSTEEAVESVSEPVVQSITSRRGGLPVFARRLALPSHFAPWEVYPQALGLAGLEMLAALRSVLGRGYGPSALAAFLRSITLTQQLFHAMGPSSTALDEVQRGLRESAERAGIPIATKINGSGRGGDVLFVAPAYTMERIVEPVLRRLRRRLGARVWLDHASWLDGYEPRGVAVEQHLGERRQSKLLPSGIVVVRVWNGRGARSMLYPTARLNSAARGFDLFLDSGERTIAIRGEMLTSRELNSTKATLAILRTLLANLGKTVPSAQLPMSAYPDRTAMQGKIIGPLKQIFRERTGKELPLTISGGVGKNFTVKFANDNLTIALVEKRY